MHIYTHNTYVENKHAFIYRNVNRGEREIKYHYLYMCVCVCMYSACFVTLQPKQFCQNWLHYLELKNYLDNHFPDDYT